MARRVGGARDGQGIRVSDLPRGRADVVEMPVADQQDVAVVDRRHLLGRGWVTEPRVEQDDLAARRTQLEA
jgi:hypothetical protein